MWTANLWIWRNHGGTIETELDCNCVCAEREPRCGDNLLRQGEIENRPIKPALQLTRLLRKLSTLQQQMALAFAQTERPTPRRSIHTEMEPIPRAALLPLRRRFDSELITILHPKLVQISCVRFMNPVLQSVLFLANKRGVIGVADAFYFFDLRNTFEFMRHTLHLMTSPGKNYCQSPGRGGEKKTRGKKRQAQRRDTSNYLMASIQTKNKIKGLSVGGSRCWWWLIGQTSDRACSS